MGLGSLRVSEAQCDSSVLSSGFSSQPTKCSKWALHRRNCSEPAAPLRLIWFARGRQFPGAFATSTFPGHLVLVFPVSPSSDPHFAFFSRLSQSSKLPCVQQCPMPPAAHDKPSRNNVAVLMDTEKKGVKT